MPQLIPPPELYSLLLWFSSCFTRPSLEYFVSFVLCFMAGMGRGTTTTVCRTSPGEHHWSNYCRFLSRYRWSVRKLSQCLLSLLVRYGALWQDDQGRTRLCVVLDETIVPKTSKRMFGVAWQRNTHGGLCRGTHILGHYWMVLCVQVRVAARMFCCPVAVRLYRQKKRCPPAEYRTPCQIARHLLRSLSWPQQTGLIVTVVADAGFADSKLLRWCHRKSMAVIVRGRIDARVHDLYVQQPTPLRGRPRKWGQSICLRDLASDERNFRQTVRLYQTRTPVQLASVVGRHHQSALPMRFVILRMAGKDDLVVMSTDLSLTPREVAQLYAERFAIELTFRELKQHFAFGHYQVRSPKGMLRHVHLSALACSLTQLLTLHSLASLHNSLLTPMKATPWRRYDTRSVGETQLRIRLACLVAPDFPHVAPLGPNMPIDRQLLPLAPLAPLHAGPAAVECQSTD